MAGRNQLLNDPEQAFRSALDGRLGSVWTALPGEITSVDLTRMIVSVQPTIQGVVSDENGQKTFVNLPLLTECPVIFMKGGGFALTFPVAVGDEVLVIFASRCIDAWWQSGGIQKPMELRMHDLSDGFVIPGVSSQPNVLPSISSNSVQLRNEAGTSFIEIQNSGNVAITAPNIQVTGNVTVTGTLVAGGISLSTHTHSGVTTGPNNSGPPNP